MAMKLNVFAVLKSMGPKYVVFRSWYEFMRRTGLMRWRYGTVPSRLNPVSIDTLFGFASPFLPMSNGVTTYSDEEKRLLSTEYRKILEGDYPYFNGRHLRVDHADWLTNPENGYRYDAAKHWTAIHDIDPAAGDIKFVWEKARFSWAYTVIRADRLFGTDTSAFIIDSMVSFIKHAPVNCGPHWRCGQEISLRVLNWIAILSYYQDSLKKNIDPDTVTLIVTSIYDQIKHVYKNRNFARIAVRNNHAITEALGLYITSQFFPFLPGAVRWKRDGKRALEREGLYQIYEDGSYIQHSFNYQRIIVQQYTFALAIARMNGDSFSGNLMHRLNAMLRFLLAMQDNTNGRLPNYGANDGALFFPVGRGEFRDFRPQIDALSCALHTRHCYTEGFWYDESAWFFGKVDDGANTLTTDGVIAFPIGGYYCIRGEHSFVMVRCAEYQHRPSQADQLHIDIWHNGRNIMRDCGSYTYDMANPLFTFFTGTGSHNTVMVNGADQMIRGPRFIWYYWTECLDAKVYEDKGYRFFHGRIRAYRNTAGEGVIHERTVMMNPNKFYIEIVDIVDPQHVHAEQLWNVSDLFGDSYTLCAFDRSGAAVEGTWFLSHYSDTYGMNEAAKQYRLRLVDGYLRTVIATGDCT